MKYRVIKPFLDKTTRKPYNEDYIYETDDIERAKELAAGGYILMLESEEKKPADEPPKGEETTPENKGETKSGVSDSDTKQTETENGENKKKTAKK